MLTDKDWVRMFRDSLKAASDFQQTKLRAPWSRNYRAFANRHMSGSKYDTAKYRHRSKLFKPKTRMAVRKNDATAAAALFSTADVVSITPERASDRLQMMTARFIHAVLNYRLDRTNRMAGPNWFLTALGARQDTQLTGICVSKQYWEYEEREYEVAIDEPVLDVNGMPVIDPLTGEGTTEEKTETRTEKVRDRIMITVIEPEHAFIDQTADWRDPIQEGGYFIAGYPMRKEDLETIIAQNSARPMIGGGAWRSDIDIAKITQANSGEMRRSEGVRRARDDGTDRYESRHADKNGEVIWLYECFYRYDGEDWHYWMLGETIILSDPRPTRDSYPEQKGDRPYVMGVGALESHKTHPTAPVETWQPLQQELNDITNLGLDARKMAISPITKIRRGRNIDWKQVQNRGPDAMIMVEDIDDVSFDRAPSPDGSAQVELNTLNVDFDELAGVFSTGSVQSNRQLNETVGGMNLMASSSNALTEYDLRVWVETWVEPCLRQCVRAIQHYESDEIVMAVAGEKAGLLQGSPSQKPSPLDGPPQGEQGEEQISFQDVMNVLGDAQVSVKVNVGIGALDSRQKLEKFMGGVKMTMEMGPLLAASGIKPNGAAMAQEAWGLLGYKDADRFFERMPEDTNKEPPPEVQKQMLDMKAKGEEAERKRLADEQSMAYEREKHQWAQEDRAREQMTRQQDEAVKHQQGVDTMTAEAESQRVAAGLPSNEAWTMLAQEMSQSREDNQQMMMAMIREFSTGQQMVAQAIQQMAIAQSAPKTVVTPDGRTFTATSTPA